VEKIMAARYASEGGADFVLCTFCNLAPVIQEAIGLDKGFHESKSFKKEDKIWEKGLQKEM
jgi:hypothetical protein